MNGHMNENDSYGSVQFQLRGECGSQIPKPKENGGKDRVIDQAMQAIFTFLRKKKKKSQNMQILRTVDFNCND